MVRSIRRGERPAVSDAGPQRQLTDRATPELWGALVGSAVALPGVEEGHSQVSPASSRALFLRNQRAQVVPWMVYGPRDAEELAVVLSIIEESLAFARDPGDERPAHHPA
jgi:hypothetical protein